jgi:hypothetical protein
MPALHPYLFPASLPFLSASASSLIGFARLCCPTRTRTLESLLIPTQWRDSLLHLWQRGPSMSSDDVQAQAALQVRMNGLIPLFMLHSCQPSSRKGSASMGLSLPHFTHPVTLLLCHPPPLLVPCLSAPFPPPNLSHNCPCSVLFGPHPSISPATDGG